LAYRYLKGSTPFHKTGDTMKDTIDLLESIGRDASLRHASKEKLTAVLVQAQASEALTAAVMSGDVSRLSGELGHVQYQTPQITHAPAHEEEPEEELPLDVPVPDVTIAPSKG
jgi:hypothetical protein